MKFSITGSVFGLILILISGYFWRILPKRRDLWRIIPRERRFGGVLGFICLLWSAYHAYPLMEGSLERVRVVLPPAVILLAILSFYWLDYLFTRAAGGLLLLIVNWMLHEAFVEHAAFRPLLSVVCYILGVAGMFMIATPYHFRDLLEKISLNRRWRTAISILLFLSGGLIFVSSVSHGL